MVSTCPACNQQVNHDDNLFEVKCACGNLFNPFMLNNNLDIPPLEPGGMGVHEEPPPAAPPIEPMVELTPEPPAANYDESNAAFQELREFGENLADGNVPPDPSPAAAAPAEPVSAPAPRIPSGAVSGDCLMTAGEHIDGYRIDAYLPPLSVASSLNLEGGDPLRPAFDLLWEQAQSQGANGVLALRWVMTPDARKVILSGTPVRATKT